MFQKKKKKWSRVKAEAGEPLQRQAFTLLLFFFFWNISRPALRTVVVYVMAAVWSCLVLPPGGGFSLCNYRQLTGYGS